ncbi:MAG: dinitrogenase iron-molybdenum cofactor biosynthesis protein [Desulfuromonas sp.]|nr:MAG: dinitrogenase iron-molybdenum cofactor biosynthesis protein [Desulfuromonas sp.]
MRIAVTSRSGTDVDQHFGHAERFLLFETVSGSSTSLGEVAVEKYCDYVPDQPFRHGRFDAIAEAIAGCRVVVTAMIGDFPRQELQRLGIHAMVANGPFEPALAAAEAAVNALDAAEK